MRFRMIALCSLLLVLTVFGSVVSADMPSMGGKSILLNGKKPMDNLKSMSLLDPERFTMKNQYMMSFSSVDGSGSMMGMYLNTMEYRFNCPLIMRVKVAYQSQTGQLFGDKNAFSGHPNMEQGRLFIPSFDLVYKMSKDTTISFHYRDYSSYNPYMMGYGGGYGMYGRRSRYGYPSRMWW